MTIEFRPPANPQLADLPARCMNCNYILVGLSEARCPECGVRFDPYDEATFYRRRPAPAWRFWTPLVLSTLAILAISHTTLTLLIDPCTGAGVSALLGTGVLVGYAKRLAGMSVVLLAVAMYVVLIAVISGISDGFSQMLTGLAFVAVLAAPLLLGGAIGKLTRHAFGALELRRQRRLAAEGD